MNVTKKLIFVDGSVESIVGKGENAGYQHLLLFPQCFQKAYFSKVIEIEDCMVKGWACHINQIKFKKKKQST